MPTPRIKIEKLDHSPVPKHGPAEMATHSQASEWDKSTLRKRTFDEYASTAVLSLEEQRLTLVRLLGEDMVKIIVGSGSGQKTFNIHKDLICEKVKYFDKMLNRSFLKAGTKIVTFPEDHAGAFRGFVTWLYTDSISTPTNTVADDLAIWVNLYGLAEKYGMVILADMTIDAIIRYLVTQKSSPMICTIELVYKITHMKSKLRGLMSKLHGYAMVNFPNRAIWATENLIPSGPDSKKITEDFVTAMRDFIWGAARPFPDPRHAPACDYHQHGKDEPCYLTKVE